MNKPRGLSAIPAAATSEMENVADRLESAAAVIGWEMVFPNTALAKVVNRGRRVVHLGGYLIDGYHAAFE